MDKKFIISTAAALFAAGTLATAAHAQSTNKCYGVNACKGQSACKRSYRTSCKGQNACKGQGMSSTGTTLECTARRHADAVTPDAGVCRQRQTGATA